MKNYIKFILYAVIFIVLNAIISCDYYQHSTIINFNKHLSLNSGCVDCGEDIGEHHNRILTYIEENWQLLDTTCLTNIQAYEELNRILTNYLRDTLQISDSIITFSDTHFLNSKYFDLLFPVQPTNYPFQFNIKLEVNLIFDTLLSLNSAQLTYVTLQETNFIKNSMNFIFDSSYFNLNLVDAANLIISKVNHQISLFNMMNWAQNEGSIACLFLSISKRSAEYWRDYNYDELTDIPNGPLVEGIVLTDAGSALIGAGISLIQQGANKGKIEGTQVVTDALEAAVYGSFPAGGKIVGNLLKGWFGKATKIIKKKLS